jgi:hypothetical protein
LLKNDGFSKSKNNLVAKRRLRGENVLDIIIFRSEIK